MMRKCIISNTKHKFQNKVHVHYGQFQATTTQMISYFLSMKMDSKKTHELTNHVIVDLTHDDDISDAHKHDKADLESNTEIE